MYGSFGEAQIEVGCATHSWSSQCTDVPTHSQLDLTPHFGLISVADAGPTQPGETAGDNIPDLRECYRGQYPRRAVFLENPTAVGSKTDHSMQQSAGPRRGSRNGFSNRKEHGLG
jgi:hypothetical protein